jgi:anti-sigma regulatory factor (Ser/Thr protein kinase)
VIVAVSDPSGVAEARRRVGSFARELGIDEGRIGKMSIAVTELASNLLKHAASGEILAVPFADAEGSGAEILALDKGPGMVDVERCMRDGYSTAGTLGTGLGAVLRQADKLRIYSKPQRGTVVSVRFVAAAPPSATTSQIGSCYAPYPGEIVSGDDWAVAEPSAGPTLMVVDGLGHGPEANRAAGAAREAFLRHAAAGTAEEIVERMHQALRPTRGAALAVARIDRATRVVHYAGIGNISGIIVVKGAARQMISSNGTAGHIAPRIRAYTYEYSAAPLVLMHSDGIGTRWDLAAYPGLAALHPSLIAGVLFRDFRRGRDDATVLAVRVAA